MVWHMPAGLLIVKPAQRLDWFRQGHVVREASQKKENFRTFPLKYLDEGFRNHFGKNTRQLFCTLNIQKCPKTYDILVGIGVRIQKPTNGFQKKRYFSYTWEESTNWTWNWNMLQTVKYERVFFGFFVSNWKNQVVLSSRQSLFMCETAAAVVALLWGPAWVFCCQRDFCKKRIISLKSAVWLILVWLKLVKAGQSWFQKIHMSKKQIHSSPLYRRDRI